MPHPTTVVVSQGRSSAPPKRQLERSLIDELSKLPGVDLLLAPHVYDLGDESETWRRLCGDKGDVVVFAWLYPRATYWTLRRAGVSGEFASGGRESKNEPGRSDRTIHCIDLRESEVPDTFLRQVHAVLSAAQPSQDEDGGDESQVQDVSRLEEQVRRRWYPVIDFDRCTNCLECLDFCLFGVYGVDEAETILVDQPDSCRQGCPACSRVCPANAIMFPQHKTPAIAGDPTAVAGFKLDLSALFGGAAPAELAEQERATFTSPEDSSSTPKANREKQSTKKDNLDELLDELDEFDS